MMESGSFNQNKLADIYLEHPLLFLSFPTISNGSFLS